MRCLLFTAVMSMLLSCSNNKSTNDSKVDSVSVGDSLNVKRSLGESSNGQFEDALKLLPDTADNFIPDLLSKMDVLYSAYASDEIDASCESTVSFMKLFEYKGIKWYSQCNELNYTTKIFIFKNQELLSVVNYEEDPFTDGRPRQEVILQLKNGVITKRTRTTLDGLEANVPFATEPEKGSNLNNYYQDIDLALEQFDNKPEKDSITIYKKKLFGNILK